MYLVYSAINNINTKSHEITEGPIIKMRYRAYQQACKKHKKEIAQIQKYIPGWYPKFDHQH